MPKPDIHEKVEAFRAQVHGAQLQGLFYYLPGVYFVVKNRAGAVMMANEVALRLCGFKREREMLGKTDFDLFSSEQADAYVADDRRVFESGQPIIEQVELAPDPANAINWLVVTKIPLFDQHEKVVGLACIGRDMTEAYDKLSPNIEMNEALEYVRQNYANPLKVEELAARCHLSVSHFERRFRKVFNTTPAQYIQQVRIRAACRLLLSGNKTISTIAQECGFYDHSHFARVFRRTMGLTPNAFRKRG